MPYLGVFGRMPVWKQKFNILTVKEDLHLVR